MADPYCARLRRFERGAYLRLRGRPWRSPYTAPSPCPRCRRDVLEGLGALAEHPDRRPHADAMEARLEAVFGDAFEFSEHLRRPVLEAAAAIYARRDPVGAAPFDARAFDAALRRVGGAVRDAAGNMKGGPFEYKGHVILPPGPGLGAAEMDVILAGAREATLLAYGNGRPVDALGRAYTAEDIRARRARHGRCRAIPSLVR